MDESQEGEWLEGSPHGCITFRDKINGFVFNYKFNKGFHDRGHREERVVTQDGRSTDIRQKCNVTATPERAYFGKMIITETSSTR